jgi:hypothetical protein
LEKSTDLFILLCVLCASARKLYVKPSDRLIFRVYENRQQLSDPA